MNRFALIALFLALPVVSQSVISLADECRECQCERCGCQCHCQKWCHVVCDWKDVKETVYCCKCTDVALPGRSEKVCTKIDECNPDNCPLFHDYKPLYTQWCPSDCVRIRPVTKLMKMEVTHKVPTYRWVVEYCCDQCKANCLAADAKQLPAPLFQTESMPSTTGAVTPASFVTR
ncbi:MAG TPA: hypothetical protein VGJ15_01550 [Pirellulales bacterium]|jgi:hypothetical protein